MNRFIYILAVFPLMTSVVCALSMVRAPHSDPVFEAIHQGDRETVLKRLEQGYDPNTRLLASQQAHTAISYAAKCRRLQILKDLVAHGGSVRLQAVRASLTNCPIDISWDHAERGQTVPSTFAYLFWGRGYFFRPILFLVVIFIGTMGIRNSLKKRASKELAAVNAATEENAT